MWEKVASRLHSAEKVFPFGPDSDEAMLHGRVTYGLKAGGENSLEWAAYARLVKVDGVVKLGFYQVYLVCVFRNRGVDGRLICVGYWSPEALVRR